MKNAYTKIFAALLLLLTSTMHAQIFYATGAVVAVSPGAILHCNGGMTIDNTSSLQQNGDLTITKNSSLPLPGTLTIDNGSTVSGDGTYHVEQDWINNATFTAGTSTVELFGNTQQFITSTNATVTTFNNLDLTGTGSGNNRKKTLQNVDARSSNTGVLNIGDRELETQTKTFFVDNTATTAVLNVQTPGSEGFVSSLAPGTFSRATNNAATYLFPTGSSLNVTKYRPVDLIPNAAGANIYTARFVNHNADNDGFLRTATDGLICNAIDTFYHAILHPSGADPADVRLYYIAAVDGPWSGMSHWRTTNNQWNDMATVANATSGVFTTLTRAAWTFANPGDPYILTDVRPAAPAIVCPTVCENSSGNIFVVNGTPNGNFQWTVPSNGNIIAGQGSDSVFVDWTTGVGFVTVYEVTSTGCNSLPDSCAPTVSPAPVANFNDTASGAYNNDWFFVDASTGATSWLWDFGDGNTSTSQNANHHYTSSGTYTVTLTTVNAAGCVDTITSIITVLEGVLIPNVFTPNGDGVNDAFYIPNSGLTEYSLEIYDRWGVKIFESTAPEIRWDGRSTSGMPCSDGTYYYILKAITPIKDYSTTGYVMLIGSKQ
jgi:gliding motility-associated-like protein